MCGLSKLVVLLSYLSLSQAAGCVLDVGGECALSRLSYGGRLWSNQDGVTHPWNRSNIFVFQTTKRGRESFGVRGRVWVTSGPKCRGSDFPLEVCPVRENIPCPVPEISLNLTTTSRRKGFARVLARWECQTPCSVKNQTIRFKQLDRGNCSPEEGGALEDILHVLAPDVRQKYQRSLKAYSLFAVTVTVVTTDDQVFSFSRRIRTNETAPTGVPTVEEPRLSLKGAMVFKWSAIECRDRNGDTISYEYQLSSSGSVWTEKTSHTTIRLHPVMVSIGTQYAFKVRAWSTNGPGEYSDTKTGTF